MASNCLLARPWLAAVVSAVLLSAIICVPALPQGKALDNEVAAKQARLLNQLGIARVSFSLKSHTMSSSIDDAQFYGCVLQYRGISVAEGKTSAPDFGFGPNVFRANLRLADPAGSEVQPFRGSEPEVWFVTLHAAAGASGPGIVQLSGLSILFPNELAANQFLAQLKEVIQDCQGPVTPEEARLFDVPDQGPDSAKRDADRVANLFASWQREASAPLTAEEGASKILRPLFNDCIEKPAADKLQHVESCRSFAGSLESSGFVEHARAIQDYACELGGDTICMSAALRAAQKEGDFVLSRAFYERCVQVNRMLKSSCELALYESYRSRIPKDSAKLALYARRACDDTPGGSSRAEPASCAVANALQPQAVSTKAPVLEPAPLLATMRAHADGPLTPEEQSWSRDPKDTKTTLEIKELCDGTPRKSKTSLDISAAQACQFLGFDFYTRLPAESATAYWVKSCQLESKHTSCVMAFNQLRRAGSAVAGRLLLQQCPDPACLDKLSNSFQYDEPRDRKEAAKYAAMACAESHPLKEEDLAKLRTYCTDAQSLDSAFNAEDQLERLRQEMAATEARKKEEAAAHAQRQTDQQNKSDRGLWIALAGLGAASMANAGGANATTVLQAGSKAAALAAQVTSDNGGNDAATQALNGAAQGASGQVSTPILNTANQQAAAIRAIGDANAAKQQQAAQARLAAQQSAQTKSSFSSNTAGGAEIPQTSGTSSGPGESISTGSAPGATSGSSVKFLAPLPTTCINQFWDPQHYNWLSLQNECSQPIYVSFIFNNPTGWAMNGSMNLASGGSNTTGLSFSDINQAGGFKFYVCPANSVPVDLNGNILNSNVAQYQCKPLSNN